MFEKIQKLVIYLLLIEAYHLRMVRPTNQKEKGDVCLRWKKQGRDDKRASMVKVKLYVVLTENEFVIELISNGVEPVVFFFHNKIITSNADQM
jgi:hypothetical protein